MKTKIVEWSAGEPTGAVRRLERIAVVERTGTEHPGERGRVHPGRKTRQRTVCEHDENDARYNGNEERPEMKDARGPAFSNTLAAVVCLQAADP